MKRQFLIWGGIAAAIWLLPSAASAQIQVDLNSSLDSRCYVEWTAGDHTILENLCSDPLSTMPSSDNSLSPSASTSSETSTIRNTSIQNTSTTIEIVSGSDSTVYVNGVQVSEAGIQNSPQTSFSVQPRVNSLTAEPYFQLPQIYQSRKYVQYQRFYPSQQLRERLLLERSSTEPHLPQRIYPRRRFPHY